MPSTCYLRSHKSYSLWYSYWGYQRPWLALIWTQIYQPDMDPDQIYETDVSPIPIIRFYRRSSLFRRRNQSQPTWSPTKYMQQTSGIHWSPSGVNNLCCQMPRLLPTFPTDSADAQIISNQRRGSLKYFQPTLGISNPSPYLLWGRLKYWLPPFHQHAIWDHWLIVP